MRWKKTLVVVSHDRDFLNNVTTDIVHLHDQGLHFYRCSHPAWRDTLAHLRAQSPTTRSEHASLSRRAPAVSRTLRYAADAVVGIPRSPVPVGMAHVSDLRRDACGAGATLRSSRRCMSRSGRR